MGGLGFDARLFSDEVSGAETAAHFWWPVAILATSETINSAIDLDKTDWDASVMIAKVT